MASLVDQIFEQAKLGTAVDPSANPFLEGVKAGQAQQHINLANRQLGMQLAQLPLQMEQQRQQNELQGLSIQNQLLQRDLRTKGLAAFNQMQQDVHPDLTEGNIDDTLNKVVSYANNHSVLWGTPEFTAMKESLFKMKQEADFAKARLQIAGAREKTGEAALIKADLPSHYMDLARQAEEEGDTGGAAQYKELSNLSLQHQQDIHARIVESQKLNDIRERRLEQSVKNASPMAKAAFATLQSKLRNIENAPRMKTEERQSAAETLMEDYERKFGQAPTGSTEPSTPTATPSGKAPVRYDPKTKSFIPQ